MFYFVQTILFGDIEKMPSRWTWQCRPGVWKLLWTEHSVLVPHIKHWTYRSWVTLMKVTQGEIIRDLQAIDIWGGKRWGQGGGHSSSEVVSLNGSKCFNIVKWVDRSSENVLLFWKSISTDWLQIVQTFRKCVWVCVCNYVCVYIHICMFVCNSPPEDWK